MSSRVVNYFVQASWCKWAPGERRDCAKRKITTAKPRASKPSSPGKGQSKGVTRARMWQALRCHVKGEFQRIEAKRERGVRRRQSPWLSSTKTLRPAPFQRGWASLGLWRALPELLGHDTLPALVEFDPPADRTKEVQGWWGRGQVWEDLWTQ